MSAFEEENAINAARQAEIAKAAKALAQSYLLTFSTEAGKVTLADIQSKGFVNESTMDKGSDGRVDALGTVANEGARTLALYIQDQIAAGLAGKDERTEPLYAESSLIGKETP